MPRRRLHRALLTGAVLLAAAVSTFPAEGAKRPSARAVGGPSYTTHTGPAMANDAGEPSIGVSWKTGASFLQASLNTAKVTYDASGAPTWTEVAPLQTALLSLDPIGFTDTATGRTFVSQLAAAGSFMAYSDDDGATWSSSQGSGLPAGVDHQTVGGGPYPQESTVRPLTNYPHAVYYCSQDIATALCARSDTGGLTFGAGVPVYALQDCWGLHGHVKVAPDGTVYLPNSDCGTGLSWGVPAVAVSTDAGLSWNIRRLPAKSNAYGDPSVAIGRDGTVYLTFTDEQGRVAVSVSTDRGVSWSTPFNLGASHKLLNGAFETAVAGDGDRAAVAFLGTRTAGDAQDINFGQDSTKTRYVGADYHLYVASTLDRGKSWTTVKITTDPVQRGRICQGGTGCEGGDRNLLDFMGITVDRFGRVLVGWPDGCTGACVDSDLVARNAHTDLGMITRQSSGTLLFRSPQTAKAW